MPKKKTKKKLTKFKGRVIPSSFDFQTAVSDVIGPHHVVYPKSRADVAAAVTLSKNLRTFIRSGIEVVKQDTVDGSGGIVINMRELANVTVVGKELKAQAGATTEMVAEQLAKHKLALPLTDNPLKSIASDVLHESPSYLMRSLGSLSNYVSRIRAVKPDGSLVTMKARATASCVEQCHDANVVITEVEFKPASARDLWMIRVSFPYPGHSPFVKIARLLFLKTKFSKLLERTDLALDAYSGPRNIPLVRISALGSSKSGKTKLRKLVREALACVPKGLEPEDIIEESLSGSDVLEAIAESGMGASLDPTTESTRIHKIVDADGDLDTFLVNHAEDIHRGIAFGDKGEGKLNVNIRLSTSLRVNRDNGLEITGYAFTPMTEDTPASISRAAPLHAGAGVRIPRPFTASVPAPLIPNFKGDVYRERDAAYKRRTAQYATSSYPGARMTPFVVAYPRDAKDIVAAIAFAQTKKKRIVARSGGHHYSGKSSGGNETILLSMDSFNRLYRPNGGMVEVGPAVRLTDLAKRFEREHVTIPHGECPLVAIGGHAQTGGYGHLVRSFGLALDYVHAFDIILADGSQLTVTRPTPGVPTTQASDELFWGVLGGNAGSFGIVTGYTFDCVRDRQHPNSYGFKATRRYKEVAFRKLMKEAQKWTKKIERGTLEPGIDFMMTVESSRITPFPVLLVELVHANLGGPNERVDGDKVFKPIIRAARHRAGVWNFLSKGGQEDLSSLSNSFVRNWPGTTHEGREFKYPYKKRINCTMFRLDDDFIEELVAIISHVVHKESRVKLVFQMLFGGGAFKNSDRRAATSIPQRDYVYCFVFDLFYKRGGKGSAERLQRKMQDLIDRHYNHGQERRVFWGTFGNVDISRRANRNMYYDSDEQYARLQALKKEVDPDDLFHTGLTVQLPD